MYLGQEGPFFIPGISFVMLGDQEVVSVREYVSTYQIFMLLIGSQAANENHLKSREVALRVSMYVFMFNARIQCFYSMSVQRLI